ncbi:hypothetical protein GCM10027345_03200 [Hymenobacter daeguensis]
MAGLVLSQSRTGRFSGLFGLVVASAYQEIGQRVVAVYLAGNETELVAKLLSLMDVRKCSIEIAISI